MPPLVELEHDIFYERSELTRIDQRLVSFRNGSPHVVGPFSGISRVKETLARDDQLRERIQGL